MTYLSQLRKKSNFNQVRDRRTLKMTTYASVKDVIFVIAYFQLSVKSECFHAKESLQTSEASELIPDHVNSFLTLALPM